MRPSVVRALFVCLLLAAYGGAQQPGWAESVPLGSPMLLEDSADRDLLEEGRTHLFSMRLDEAEEVFDVIAGRSGGAVAATYHKALMALLQNVLTDDADYAEAFDGHYGTLLDALSAAPESRWQTYLAAEARLMRTLMLAKENRPIRAAFAARGAYRRYQDAAEGEASFPEPYKGLGVFHLAIGSLPSGYQRVLSILGFSGSIEQGIEELEKAREGTYAKTEATAYLALVDAVIRYRTANAVARLEELQDGYPESPLMAYLLSYALLEDRQGTRALDTARFAVQQGQQPTFFFVDYAEYYLAESLFRLNRFGEAATYFRRYLARHGGPALRAPANLHAALALEMTDRRADALVFYRRVRADRDFDADEAAYRHAQRRIDAPLTAPDRMLLRATNAFYAGQYALSTAYLRQLIRSQEAGSPVWASAHFYLGRTAFTREAHDAARDHFETVLLDPGRTSDGLAPWSHFYLGQMAKADGRLDVAEERYASALDASTPFHYHRWLEQRVAAAREALAAASDG